MHGEQHAHAGLCGGQRSSLDVVPQKLSIFFPFSFSIFHVLVWSMCVWTQVCTKRFGVMSGFMLSCSSILFIEAESLGQTRSPNMVSLASQFAWGILLLPWQAGITGRLACPSSISSGFLGLPLHVKHFNCWTIFPPHQSSTLFFIFIYF